MFAPKKILVPSDFSDFSDDALSEAVEIALQYKSTVYLLHVISIVRACTMDYCLTEEAMGDVRTGALKAAQDMMQEQVARIPRIDEVELIKGIREGAPTYEEILDEQKERGADLIVIASHGRTGLLDHLLGSVADKVIRGAPCPVYLVKRARSGVESAKSG